MANLLPPLAFPKECSSVNVPIYELDICPLAQQTYLMQ